MLTANKEKLQSFFQGFTQYRIPFFQRSYVWKKDDWTEFWDDIMEEFEAKKGGNPNSEHFIGTVIIKQAESERVGSLLYDLIDGQQRLTTICLLLRALHDFSKEPNLRNWILSLLVYKDSYGASNIRIIHSKVDRKYFAEVILSETDNAILSVTENKVVHSYAFFKAKIASVLKEDDIREVVDIILQKLPVVHMALSKEDDVQQIFDTINSLGVKLTAGELLKNYLFSLPGIEEKYEDYWQNIFESDEESVEFWNKDKTSGRIVRSTIELFLYSYLVIIKESVIKIESLFKEYKQYLKDKKTKELLTFAKELSEYAVLYETLPDGEDLVDIAYTEHEKRFFHLMNELDITTVFPLVLFIYKNVSDLSERQKIMLCLESYLVRRTICKLTTKNYNNLFIAILVDLKKQKTFTSDDFAKKLNSYQEDTNRFPDDAELKVAFGSKQLINQYSKEILYCIALYQMSNNSQDTHRLDSLALSVEHVMPKKWKNKWTLPSGADENTRHSLLLTLGNLTLIKGRLNSSMRDSNWTKKKEELRKFSTLRITTDYLANAEWDEAVIAKRGVDLFNTAILIWKK